MERIFVDTSAWYALVDDADPDHAESAGFRRRNRLGLVTTNFVFDEAITLVRLRLGHRAAVELDEKLRSSRLTTVVAVRGEDEGEAWRTFARHDDKRWSYTDCTSFVVMRRLGLAIAFALGDDFRQAGFRCVPPPRSR